MFALCVMNLFEGPFVDILFTMLHFISDEDYTQDYYVCQYIKSLL